MYIKQLLHLFYMTLVTTLFTSRLFLSAIHFMKFSWRNFIIRQIDNDQLLTLYIDDTSRTELFFFFSLYCCRSRRKFRYSTDKRRSITHIVHRRHKQNRIVLFLSSLLLLIKNNIQIVFSNTKAARKNQNNIK